LILKRQLSVAFSALKIRGHPRLRLKPLNYYQYFLVFARSPASAPIIRIKTRPKRNTEEFSAVGRIAGGEEFVVGYDGQAYIKGLSPANEAEIEFTGGKCRASFPFAPIAGQQVQITRVECR